MNKILTISIAAYNVEKYISQLLDSIIDSEVIDSLEVLVVNDGSVDNTASIVKKYQDKFPTSIFLVDKKNGGHGSTINKGIEKANSKYFKVIDGDDWVNPVELKKLVEKLYVEESDVILCDYEEHYIDSNIIKKFSYSQFESGKKISFDEACSQLERIQMHSIVFKTSILKKLPMKIDENCFYVDVEYVLYPTPFLRSFTYYPFSVYCYRLGDINQSMSIRNLQKNIKQHEKVSMHMLEYCSKCYDQCEENVKKYILSSLMLLNYKTYQVLLSFPLKGSIRREIETFDGYVKNVFPEEYKIMKSKTICVMRKNIKLLYPLVWLWFKTKD